MAGNSDNSLQKNDPRCLLADEYCHESYSVVYIPDNIPGQGANMEEFETQLVAGCKCINSSCDSEVCPCIIKFGRNYFDGKLLREKFNGPVMECNATCNCNFNSTCKNRVVQRGPCTDLEVYDSGMGKGLALRAKADIVSGTFICEYAGEVISKEEARKRFQVQRPMEKNYIFALMEHMTDGSVIQTFVDPTFIGNIGRYINHSCEPNCVVVPVRVDSPIPRLSIFATCNIPGGDEITFDYGQSSKGAVQAESCRKVCLCGSKNCRKYLPFDDVI